MAFASNGMIPYHKEKHDLFFVFIEQSSQETFAKAIDQVQYDGYTFFIVICTKSVFKQPEKDFAGTPKKASRGTEASETGF